MNETEPNVKPMEILDVALTELESPPDRTVPWESDDSDGRTLFDTPASEDYSPERIM
jgi:hypothetical protein